jgi:hypothetical protein
MVVKNVALQELKINNSNAKFLYDFKDLLYSNKTVLEAAEREKLIKYLV